MPRFSSQAHAEDLVLWHRYNYYVRGCALISDAEYDALEDEVRALWSVCICGIGGSPGSDVTTDYPHYIVWGIRPGLQERLLRDKLIADRWMENL